MRDASRLADEVLKILNKISLLNRNPVPVLVKLDYLLTDFHSSSELSRELPKRMETLLPDSASS